MDSFKQGLSLVVVSGRIQFLGFFDFLLRNHRQFRICFGNPALVLFV